MYGADGREIAASRPDPYGWRVDDHGGSVRLRYKLYGDRVDAYPERGVAWVATRHPERPVPEGGDEGVIARFDLPRGE